jgi:ABC-type antimicrobial peptide transport system permease subunit
MLGTLATILAILALVILAVGVFAIVSFTIEQTRRSIGIRIAIGATASRIVREFVLQMAIVVGIGVIVGLVGVLNLSPVIGSQLFRISARDPLALVGAVILLSAISLGLRTRGTTCGPH